MYTGSNTPFRVPQSLELINFLFLTSSWLIFYWHLHLIASCHQLSICGSCFSSLPPVVLGVEPYPFLLVHAHKVLDFQFSLDIFNYKCLGLIIQRQLSYLFIYLSIHSIFYERFNYVTISCNQNCSHYEKYLLGFGSIMEVGVLPCCALLHSVWNLKAAQMSVQCSRIQ